MNADGIEEALAKLAKHEASRRAPHTLDAIVLGAFERRQASGRGLRPGMLFPMAAVTLTLIIGVALLTMFDLGARRDQPLRQAAPALGHAVYTRMPRAMLPALGVPIIDPDASGMVGVEMLIGSDGVARSIRIVP
jgi:hypothetical protein